MSSFISYLISGISLGSVYAIIALGYTMVYGIAKMLNFAHGDVIMVGSYVVYVAVSGMGLNPILAILLSFIICTLMGVVIEGVAYRPLRNAASPLAVLITAIGVSYLLQNVALLIWGADTKSFSNVISLPSLKLAVFYPKHGVSPIQEKQMVTQKGNNTYVVGITGNFDDAYAYT